MGTEEELSRVFSKNYGNVTPETAEILLEMFDKTGSRQIDLKSFCKIMGYLHEWLKCYQSYDNAVDKIKNEKELQTLYDQIRSSNKSIKEKEIKQTRLECEIDELQKQMDILEKQMIKKKNDKEILDTEVSEMKAKRQAS